MGAKKKRYSVSIEPNLDADLKKLKQEEHFKNLSQSDMLRFLIREGLHAAETSAEIADKERKKK